MAETRWFERDERKATENLRKHRIPFGYAIRAFDDPLAIELLDETPGVGEERWTMVGGVEGRLLIVTYTMRQGVFRLISARTATARERRGYYEQGR